MRPPKAPAARQALAVLSCLAGQAGPVPAAAISRDLQLPRSTTYQLLSTVADSGFVVHLADERRYSLGVAAYELGTGYLPRRRSPGSRGCRWPGWWTAPATPCTWP